MEKTDKSAEEIDRELIKKEAMDKYPDIARNGLSFPDYNSTQRMAYINGIITERTRAAQQISEYKEVVKELLPIVKSFDYKGFNAYQEIIDRAKKLIEK